jgi:hypothetical protein
MSEENVELVLSLYDAAQKRDYEEQPCPATLLARIPWAAGREVLLVVIMD